jgi:ABC-type nitrate/sulfonate/bicarbonate transport system ATPase subunit
MQTVVWVTHDIPKGLELGEVGVILLPANAAIDNHAKVNVHLGPSPSEGDAKGEVLE